MNGHTCTLFAVRVGGEARSALEVCIEDSNVYVNYFDRQGQKVAHTSYHASGQHNIKKNGDYIFWTGGPSGQWQPMKFFRPRPEHIQDRQHVAVIGWGLDSVPSVLPTVSASSQVQVFEVPPDADFQILVFEVSIVGSQVQQRDEVNGFPVIWRYKFSAGITVEIEAVAVKQSK